MQVSLFCRAGFPNFSVSLNHSQAMAKTVSQGVGPRG